MSPSRRAFIERSVLALTLGSLGVAAPSHAAAAEDPASFPSRPLRMVVPFAPGGGTDVLARIFGQKLGAMWPNAVTVDNRPGASATIGTEIVARAKPDGLTMLLIADTHAINVSLYNKLPYDPVKDFSPVILLATAPHIVVVHPTVPAHSLKELIDYAKSRPGVLNYSSSGPAGTSYVLTEILRTATGMNLVHVPYKGGGPAMTALVAGETQVTIAPAVTTLSQWRSNRARPLAVLSAQRSPLLPGIPTLVESGYPDIVYESWYGVLAPAGTPAGIVNKVNADIQKAMALPDVQSQLEAQGLQAAGGSPAEFDRFIRSEMEKWAKAIKTARVPPANL
jgi:tripartite-type tricarboxylate transporter receptor subunit TctC